MSYPNKVKSIILRPPFFLSFTKVDFFIFGILYFYIKSKISLLISSAKVAGVLNTLQTKVNFEIAIVFAIRIRPCIDISFADQMFRIFLKESGRSKKFFSLQVAHHKRSRHLEHRGVLHLTLFRQELYFPDVEVGNHSATCDVIIFDVTRLF